jgi:hypothetical protein
MSRYHSDETIAAADAAEAADREIRCETCDQYSLISEYGTFVEGDPDDTGFELIVNVYFSATDAYRVGEGEQIGDGADTYYTIVSTRSGPEWADRIDAACRDIGFTEVVFRL